MGAEFAEDAVATASKQDPPGKVWPFTTSCHAVHADRLDDKAASLL